jgi:hypothetical protein
MVADERRTREPIPVTVDVESIRGPHHPAASTPPRDEGSVRRTSVIDTTRPEDLLGPLLVRGTARDLRTDRSGAGTVVGEAAIELHVGRDRNLAALQTSPARPALDGLLGGLVGPGFRNRLDALAPYLDGGTAPLFMLLDDVPGAVLVSGYAMLVAGLAGEIGGDTGDETKSRARHDEFLAAQADLCAGWATDASMMQGIRATGRNLVPVGPVAPKVERVDDPLAWQALPPLPPHATRRLRRTDVIAPVDDEPHHRVEAWFRDSHMSDAGVETVLHEYGLVATVDADAGRVLAVDAAVHVLPWMECPQAIGSADRITGRSVADLRRWVREHLSGTTTCTHLNDVLRNLADVDTLLTEL